MRHQKNPPKEVYCQIGIQATIPDKLEVQTHFLTSYFTSPSVPHLTPILPDGFRALNSCGLSNDLEVGPLPKRSVRLGLAPSAFR